MEEFWLVVWNENGKAWWEFNKFPSFMDQACDSKMDLMWHLVSGLCLLPYNGSVWTKEGNQWTNLGTIEVGTIDCPE